MNDLSRCYEVLGLRPGASESEIKEAYREMAFVWHPDRFPANSKLQQKAQQKMKEINAAYQKLESSGIGARSSSSPKPPPSRQEPRPNPPPPPPPRQEPKSKPTTVACSCGYENSLDEIYCQGCGRQLAGTVLCRHCKDTVPINAVYCPSCGMKL